MQRVQPVLLVQQALPELLAQRAPQDYKALQEMMEQPVQSALPVQSEQQVFKVQPVLSVLQALPELPVQQVQQDYKGLPEMTAQLVPLVQQVQSEQLACKVLQV